MRGAGVVVAAGLLALTACSAGEPAAGPTAPSASTAPTSPSTSSAPAAPVQTPEATEPPTTPPTPTREPLADLVEGIDVVDEPVLGADISWPQCPVGMGIAEKRTLGSPLPVDEARYVVVGLTNGPGFYPNPCLADQVGYLRERGLLGAAYAVASYPEPDRLARHGADGPFDGATPLGALANTGYQQARFNVASMEETGFETPVVWIDVEPVPDFEWSADVEANAAVVTGVARGYEDAGYRIGVYSTAYLWDGVVGDLELGLPEWRAAGQTSREEALARCEDGAVIQGGPAVLGQWVQDNRDMNVTCPGTSLEMELWFHQF